MRITTRPRPTSVGSPPPPGGSKLIRYSGEASADDCVTGAFLPLGIPLAVEGTRPELLAAVAEACRGWEADADGTAKPIRLNLALSRDLHRADDPEIEVEGQRLWIRGGGVEAWADADSGCAECLIDEELLRDAERLRQEVLDPLILFLVTRRGRTPLHASAFVARELAVLLAGPSGTGKSCLALAAYEAGFRVLSDDAVYIQLEPELCIWGVPRPIHLFPEDAPTGSGNATRIRSGKLKHSVRLDSNYHAIFTRRAVLCVLNPGTKASLQRIGNEEAMRALGELDPGFDLLRGDIEVALETLARHGAWRLTLSADPAEAIDLLHRNLALLGSIAAP